MQLIVSNNHISHPTWNTLCSKHDLDSTQWFWCCIQSYVTISHVIMKPDHALCQKMVMERISRCVTRIQWFIFMNRGLYKRNNNLLIQINHLACKYDGPGMPFSTASTWNSISQFVRFVQQQLHVLCKPTAMFTQYISAYLQGLHNSCFSYVWAN